MANFTEILFEQLMHICKQDFLYRWRMIIKFSKLNISLLPIHNDKVIVVNGEYVKSVKLVKDVKRINMSDKPLYYLCGGTFLGLLLHVKSSDKSEPDVMKGLLHVIDARYQAPPRNAEESFKGNVSDYKYCKKNYTRYLKFNNQQVRDNFDAAMKNNYIEVLDRMAIFANNFIDLHHSNQWLGDALIELLDCDVKIKHQEMFIMDNGNRTRTKKELCESQSLTLENLLLGFLHFIIIKRWNNNKDGIATISDWYTESAGGQRRSFVSNIGRFPEHDIDFFTRGISTTHLTINNDEQMVIPPHETIPEGIVNVYLEKAHEKYHKLKTLLYTDAERDFYDFYVCNTIYQCNRNSPNKRIDASINAFNRISNFILISGTGGLGKSMLMRHLLLSSVRNYKFGDRIPIFLPLKDFVENSLHDFAYDCFSSRIPDEYVSENLIDDFHTALQEGKFILLFDGMDEICSESEQIFQSELEKFTDKFPKNIFIISSRPYKQFISLSKFYELHLQPFSKMQALELIKKLDFRPDEPDIKKRFATLLDVTLYKTHSSFVENPLLLTIMLMTFEQFAEIPDKMHIFYHDAYVALAQKHDATKGAFKRTFHTGLTAEEFEKCLTEFCGITYVDEKVDFTEEELRDYYTQIDESLLQPSRIFVRINGTDNLYKPSAENFIYDMTVNLCLMYNESRKYHFTHRSFQEYFCALFFSKQTDEDLKTVADFFETRGRGSDNTFSMLYDMIPMKVEQFILLPFLEKLISDCENEDGYPYFLKTMYSTIYYEEGDVDEIRVNTTYSYIYEFIVRHILGLKPAEYDFDFESEFINTSYVYYLCNWNKPPIEYINGKIYKNDPDEMELCDIDSLPPGYKEKFGEPDIVGHCFSFNIDDILEDIDYSDDCYNETYLADEEQVIKEYIDISRYPNICEELLSEDSPLRKEYEQVKVYLQTLKDKGKRSHQQFSSLFKKKSK